MMIKFKNYILLGFLFGLTFGLNAQNTCATATPVTDLTGVVCATSSVGTTSTLTSGGCEEGTIDTWFSFVAQGNNADITVSNPISGWRPEFLVIESSDNTCTGAFTLMNCTDQSGNYTSITGSVASLTPGNTYWIVVSSNGNLTSGTLSVCVTNPLSVSGCAVTSDDCAAPVLNGADNNSQVCQSSCNTGNNPGPDFTGNNCYDFPDATSWFQVTAPAGSAQLSIDITSPDLTNPYYSIFTTAGCTSGSWTIIDCYDGGSGGAISGASNVTPGTTYLIAVSDENGLEGDFDFCADFIPDASLCNVDDEMIETGSSDPSTPVGGPYSPGESVTFCYTINQYLKEQCNWLQGIIPTFGDCWDPSSFNPDGSPVNVTSPIAQAGNNAGVWSWWPDGAVQYNAGHPLVGQNSGAGWYFVLTAQGSDPDNTYGDGGAPGAPSADCDPAGNGYTWTVCFELIAGPTSNCSNGTTDCGLSINTVADGEVGVWPNNGCNADTDFEYNAGFICCPTFNNPGPQIACESFTLPAITGVLMTGFEMYYSGPNGTSPNGGPWLASNVINFADLPSYPYTLYIYDATSCGLDTPFSLTIGQTPVVTFAPLSNVCVNSGVQVLGGGLPTGGVYSGTGVTDNGNGLDFNFDPSTAGIGVHTLQYSYTDVNTCMNSNTSNIEVVALPNFVISGFNNPAICGTSTGDITLSGLTPLTGYSLSYLDDGVPVGPLAIVTDAFGDYVITGLASGTYSSITISDANCSFVQGPVSLSDLTGPTFMLSGSNPTTCNGVEGSITITGLIASTNYDLTYSDDGVIVGPVNILTDAFGNWVISGLNAGSYTDFIIDIGGCAGTNAGPINLVDPTIPIASPTTTTADICEGATILLEGNNIAGATYSWSGPNGFSSTNEDESIALAGVVNSGTYTFTITNNGCISVPATVDINVNPLPVATPTTSTPAICEGLTILLNGNTISGATYSWSGPNGFSSVNEDVSINSSTPANSGTYSLTITENGCVSLPQTVDVLVYPTPVASPTTSTPVICEGGTILLEGNTIVGATYAWTGPNGFSSINEDESITSSTPANSGTYSLTVTNNGCVSSPVTVNVTVNPTPIASPTTSTPVICEGSTILLEGNTIVGATYAWSGPNGFSSVNEDESIASSTIANSGTYSLTVTNNGCVSLPVTVNVTVNPVPTASPTTSTPVICEGSTILLEGNTIVGATYAWTGPNGFSSVNEDESIASSTTANSGTYSLTVTNNGCVSSPVTVNVTVNPAPTASPTTSTPVICEGATILLEGNTIVGATYAWSGPNGFSSVNEDESIASSTTANSGTYTLIVTENGCVSAPASVSVTVNSYPTIPSVSGDNEMCQFAAMEDMTASGTGGVYTWYSDATLTSVLGSGNSLTPNNSVGTTSYYVTETVNGCEGPANVINISIVVCDLLIPTGITPDASPNETWELVNLDLVYPNNIVSIYNRWGNLIYSHESNPSNPYSLNPWDGTYEGKKLPVASYYYIINLNNEAKDALKGTVTIIRN